MGFFFRMVRGKGFGRKVFSMSLGAFVSGGALLWSLNLCRLVQAQVTVEPQRLVFGPRLFGDCLLATDSGPGALAELKVLREAIAKTRAVDRMEVAALMEAYMAENPASPWVPSLHVALGRVCYWEGLYTGALEHWAKAWELTGDIKDGPGTVVGDQALAEHARLLTELGRLEQVDLLLAETKERLFYDGSALRKHLRTIEMHGRLRHYPSLSYRCGFMVLDQLSREVRGTGVPWAKGREIYADDKLFDGCSMLAISRLSRETRLPLVGVERPDGVLDLPVPCILHLKQGHYVALLRRWQGTIWVYDPLRGRVYLRPETLNREASGRFMVPAGSAGTAWPVLSDAEMAVTVGRCYAPQDSEDGAPECSDDGSGPPAGTPGCCGGGDGYPGSNSGGNSYVALKPWQKSLPGTSYFSGAHGMVRWRVSEPNLNLWLEDTPLVCFTKQGVQIPLTLFYKQRSEGGLQSDVFSFGNGWHCEWQSWVDTNNGVVVHLPRGEVLTFEFPPDENTASSYFNNSRLTRLVTNDTNVIGFALDMPDGRYYHYTNSWLNSWYVSACTNAQGIAIKYDYQVVTNEDEALGLRLTSIKDHADQTLFELQYETNVTGWPNLVKSVTSQEKTASFSYVSAGYRPSPTVSQIVDPVLITSQIEYDGYMGWPTNLTTPYGSTGFTYANGLYHRGIEVTEPNQGRSLYLALEDCGTWFPDPVQSGLVPTVPAGYSLDTTMSAFNSFYWNQRQAEGVPSLTDLSQLQVTNLNKARLRHWLKKEAATGVPDSAKAYERQPSTDDVGDFPGQITWYDYPGKPAADTRGTNILPSLIAMRMPDDTTWMKQITRNNYGLPTQEVETWVDLNNVTQTRTNTYVYAANDQDLVAHFGPGNVRKAGYAYDAAYPHQPVAFTNALNEVTYYYYDSSMRTTWIGRPLGLNTTNVYGASDGFLWYTCDFMGTTPFRTNTYTWGNGQIYTHTDERGLTTTHYWDGLGRPTQVSYSATANEMYRYTNAAGLMLLDRTATCDRLGNWSFTVYNGMRQVTDTIDPLTNVTHYTYCSCGSPDSVTRAYDTTLAQTTTYSHNNQGLLWQTVHPDGSSELRDYDALRRVVATTDYWGSTTNYYDNLGRLSVVENAGGVVLDQSFNADNLVTNQIDAGHVEVSQTYDDLGRLSTRSYVGGGTETWGYTANVAGATSYTSQITNVVRYVYDAAGRKTEEVSGTAVAGSFVAAMTNQFGYASAGDLITLTDGMGRTTQWDYDAFGRVLRKYDQQSAVILTNDYNAVGQLTARWSKAKGLTGYSYDAAGHLTGVDYPTSTNLSFAYDALYRITNMVDAAGTTKYSYAILGYGLSTVTEDGPWDYDDLTVTNRGGLRGGFMLTQPASQFVVTNQYDALKRLTTVGGTAGTFLYHYTNGVPAPQVQSIELSSGAYITNWYDPLGRLVSTELRTGGGTLLNGHAYDYNLGNQRWRQTRTDSSTVDYTYDPLGQLLSAVGSGGQSAENLGYLYDAAQNLNRRTNGVAVAVFGVDSLNQLTNAPAGDCVYDDNGNLLSESNGRTFAYDDENQLICVVSGTSNRTDFFYDGLGRLRRTIEYEWTTEDPAASETEVPKSSMTLSASSEWSGWEAANTKDGLSTDPGWANTTTGTTDYLRVDMGSSRKISRVAYTPRVMSASDADGSWNGVYRRYEIYVTDDSSGTPANWGAPVVSGEWSWPNRQERKDVRFTPKTGRYVYFRRVTSWGWYGPMGYASANEIWVYETTGNGGSAITTPLVTAVTLATNAVPRNDFSGWVGCRLQVGNTETIATHLGRWVLSGNTGTHTIKLVQSDGVDVGGGSVTVTASGTAGQYVYAPLSTKVALAANAAYYLVSQEAQGGDRWYNSSDCLLTLSGVATLPGPVWTYNGPPTYYWAASSNASYVPVGMKYWTGTNEPTWVAASERWYVYDGMVVVQERDKNNVPKVSYTRGLDLSGSRQGAGGIGGLLARSEHGTSASYAISRTDCYHADGNGNITALHSTNAVLSAIYQYDPYGNVMSYNGDLKDANVYRFSSKMFHPNSGLYYYGYRFYDPNLQRWPNRDPLGSSRVVPGTDSLLDNELWPFEYWSAGNLYHFVFNNPVKNIDPLGLDIFIIRDNCSKFGHEVVIGGNGDGTYWESDKMPGSGPLAPVSCPANISFRDKSSFDPNNLGDPCYSVRRHIVTSPAVDARAKQEAQNRANNTGNERYDVCANNCRDYANSIGDFALGSKIREMLRKRSRGK